MRPPLVAVLVLAALAASDAAVAQRAALPETDAVGVAWEFPGRDPPPSAPWETVLRVTPSSEGCRNVGVWNGLDAPIRNVALTLDAGAAPLGFTFQVHADDTPPYPFAVWNEVPPGGVGVGCLVPTAGPGASGDVPVLAMVFFDHGDGRSGVATQTLVAHVEPVERGAGAAAWAVPLAVALAAVGPGSGSRRLSRRGGRRGSR